MPPPITAQVATVRHSTSVPAKFQIASRQATIATKMQALVVQKDIFVTMRGLRKPLFICLLSNGPPANALLLNVNRNNCQIGANRTELSHRRDA
jgi:hypothetical protein